MTRTRFFLAVAALALLVSAVTHGARADSAADKAAEEAAKAEAKALAERLGDKERAVREEALVEAKANQHPLVTAALVKRLGDDFFELRETAIEALATREAEACKRGAAQALGARLAKVPGGDRLEERLLVIDALRRLAQVNSLKALADDIDIKMDAEELGARTMAIANVPDAKAIELLIDLRARAGRGAANEANRGATLLRRALTSAIGQDLGGDTDAWRIWWKDNKKDFDFAAAAERRRAAEEKADQREARLEERKEKRKKKRDGEEGGSSTD
ncbi:MAG: hypothetical protein AB7T63_05690 [Planctomycetota bacterium]